MDVTIPPYGVFRLVLALFGVFATARGVFLWGRGDAKIMDKIVSVLGVFCFSVFTCLGILASWLH